MTKATFISDTHGRHDHVKISPCDLLVHSGDCTYNAGRASLREFLQWLERQPAPIKILIAGNHDWAFEKWPDLARAMVKEVAPSVIYLQDSAAEVYGLKVWGSPVSPRFFDWAFNRDRGADIKRHWDMIPDDTDLLVTHGPPKGFGDWSPIDKIHAGDDDLLEAIKRVRPAIHACGHFHGGNGMRELKHDEAGASVTLLINASICDEGYHPVNQPITITL